MKFGGTSVADPQKIKDVARRLVEPRRRAGNRVVAVLSAMGDSTDDLVRLAYEVSPQPEAARARHADLGRRADLLRACRDGDPRPRRTRRSRSPARRPGSSPTPCTAARRSSTSAPAASTRRSTRTGSCSSPASRASRPTSTSRRSAAAAPTRPRSRSPPRSAPRSARSTPTSRASSPPTRGSCRRRASCTRSASRRCSRWPPRARRCSRYARSRSRAATTSSCTSAPLLLAGGRHLDSRGGRSDAREGAHLRSHAHARGDASTASRARPPRSCSPPSPRRASTSTRSSRPAPEIVFSAPADDRDAASEVLDSLGVEWSRATTSARSA